MTGAEEIDKRENGQKLAQECEHVLFLEQREKTSLCQNETPRMAEGITGKQCSKCSLFLSKNFFTLSPVKAVWWKEGPQPKKGLVLF